MSVIEVALNEHNSRKAEELSRQTGKAPDELVNEAVEGMGMGDERAERVKLEEWRKAMLRVAGIWKDRDDLPDFEAMRKSWDRNLWGRS